MSNPVFLRLSERAPNPVTVYHCTYPLVPNALSVPPVIQYEILTIDTYYSCASVRKPVSLLCPISGLDLLRWIGIDSYCRPKKSTNDKHTCVKTPLYPLTIQCQNIQT